MSEYPPIARVYSKAHRKWISVGDDLNHFSKVTRIERGFTVDIYAHTPGGEVRMISMPPDATFEFAAPAPEMAE